MPGTTISREEFQKLVGNMPRPKPPKLSPLRLVAVPSTTYLPKL